MRLRVCAMPQRLQEARDAVALGRRPHQQRHDMAFAQFPREIVENQVARRLDIADQLLHQRIVVIGEALEHGIARLFLVGRHAVRHFYDFGRRRLAIDEGPLQREIDEAGGDPILPNGDLPQQQRRARSRLEQFQRLAYAAACEVNLVEEQQPGHAERLEFAEDALQRGNFLRVRLADYDRGVADRQHVTHVVHEFDRAGAVDEGEPVAEIVDMRDVGLDAHRMGARFRAGVADARALPHRSLPRRAAAANQQPLEQAGLAALKWADDRYQSGTGDPVIVSGAIGGHFDPPPGFRAVRSSLRARRSSYACAVRCRAQSAIRHTRPPAEAVAFPAGLV